MSRAIAHGIQKSAKRLAKAAAEDISKSVGGVVRQAGHGIEKVAKNAAEAEAKHVEHLRSIHTNADGKPKKPKKPSTGYEALDKLNRSRRPAIRKRQQFEIFKSAKRASNGEDFICPSSGKTIRCERDKNGKAVRYNEHGKRLKEGDPGYDKGFTRPAPNKKGHTQNYNFGHVQGSEYWRLKQLVADHPNQFEWSDVRNEYDRPSHYQVEDPATNQAHGSEDKTPGYGHYGGLHDRLKQNQAATHGSSTPDALSEAGPKPKRRRR